MLYFHVKMRQNAPIGQVSRLRLYVPAGELTQPPDSLVGFKG